MANRAYAGFWLRDSSERLPMEHLERFLETIPVSSKDCGFRNLTLRAISSSEPALVEHDLGGDGAKPADIAALTRELASADCACEIEGSWALWSWDSENLRWTRGPERFVLICQGDEYDEGAARNSGHFLMDVGLEHLYTGHSGLLGSRRDRTPAADPIESRFLAWMSQERNLREYHQKTQENIQHLLNWVQDVERALPLERVALWSEGEENLEARLDDILAAH